MWYWRCIHIGNRYITGSAKYTGSNTSQHTELRQIDGVLCEDIRSTGRIPRARKMLDVWHQAVKHRWGSRVQRISSGVLCSQQIPNTFITRVAYVYSIFIKHWINEQQWQCTRWQNSIGYIWRHYLQNTAIPPDRISYSALTLWQKYEYHDTGSKGNRTEPK